MYFDAVLNQANHVVLNDTPAETKKWVQTHLDSVHADGSECSLAVNDGRTLKFFTMREYVAK